MAILQESGSRQPVSSATRLEIITDALGRLRAVPVGQSIPAEDLKKARFNLEIIVGEAINSGLHLWTWDTITLFTKTGQSKYQLGRLTSDHWAKDPSSTTTTSALIATDTTIPVTSSAGMAANDFIGVMQDDGLIFWSTISSVPDSTSVILNAGLDSASASGSVVYFYTVKADRPLRTSFCQRRTPSGTDIPLEVYSKEEYVTLPGKENSGAINIVYYDPQLGLGELNTWNAPSDSSDRLMITAYMPILGFREDSETVDFPQQWNMALIDRLTERLAPHYGQMANLPSYVAIADKSWERAEGFDNEGTSIYFQAQEGY